MSIKAIKEQLEAIQFKYDALKPSSTSFAGTGSRPMQFTTPKPKISVETLPEKNDAIQSAMLEYILNKYGKKGKNILSPKEENLLLFYIEGYLLNQNFIDPKGEFHTILQLVHEAGAECQIDSKMRIPISF
ncbi:MAG TPA: hypothetical protein PLV31_04180 [Gammaproteobacteria bacterium]|nr:hypothetical protein [Gammaproteobacteria bacterium]HRA42869.1 hypothetical protein [Gammaproteobacteria bacterium]